MTRLRIESPAGPAQGSRPEGPDSIGAWLDRLLRLARLPSRESAEIRDELDAHLRERVRDLMLAGHDEPEAIHKSISELGDLAVLAHRYRDASRTPKGRNIMQFSLIVAVGAALGLSTLAYRQAQPAQPAADGAGSGSHELTLEVRPKESGEIEVVPVLRDIPIVSRFFTTESGSGVAIEAEMRGPQELAALLQFLAESQGLKAYIHWRDLESVATPDEGVDELPLQGQSPDRAFEMINDSLGLDGSRRLAFRAEAGLLEIATQRFFDRRDRELVTYDVSGLLNADEPLEVTEESGVLVDLITEIIEPDSWSGNGGDVGSIFAAGDKLFVSGPPRLQERVAWLLTKLMDGGEQHASAREEALTDFVVAALTRADPTLAENVEIAPLLERVERDPAAIDTSVLESLRAAVDHPGRTEMYPLQWTPVDELIKILGGALAPLGGSVTADARTNALLVLGSDEVQQKAAAIIRALDRDPNGAPAAAPGSAQPTSLRIRGENGRVVAEMVGSDGARGRLEAAELEIVADGIRDMLATDARIAERASLDPR